jgi:IS1 family transposase
MSNSKYALFYALLKNLRGYEKEAAVYDFTDGRTTHLSELTEKEYRGLCNYLQGIVNLDAGRRRAGSRVLNLLTEMGFKTVKKEDWAVIDNFLLDKRIAGKRYRELNTSELNNLAVKLRSMRDKGYHAKEMINSHEKK